MIGRRATFFLFFPSFVPCIAMVFYRFGFESARYIPLAFYNIGGQGVGGITYIHTYVLPVIAVIYLGSWGACRMLRVDGGNHVCMCGSAP